MFNKSRAWRLFSSCGGGSPEPSIPLQGQALQPVVAPAVTALVWFWPTVNGGRVKSGCAWSCAADSPPLPPGCCGDRWPTDRWAAAAAAPRPGCWGRARGWTNPGPPPPAFPGSNAPRTPAPAAPPPPGNRMGRWEGTRRVWRGTSGDKEVRLDRRQVAF